MTENAPAQVGKTAVATTEEPSIGQLIAEATRDISTLVQNEITLAKSELKLSVKAGGTGIGLFAGAGFILLLSVVMFSFGLAFLISMTGLHLAWSFFLVFALYVSAAAGLGYVGYTKVRKVRPPERAITQAQETKNALLHRP